MASPERRISRRTFLVTVALGTAGALVGLPAVIASGSKPEVSSGILTFTDKERKTLIDDGAVIYLPTGEAIRDQKSAW